MLNIDKFVDMMNLRLKKVADNFAGEVDKILQKIEKSVILLIGKDIDPLKADVELHKILKKSGYYDAVNSLIQAYDVANADIKQLLLKAGITAFFTSNDIEALKALKLADLDEFKQFGIDTIKQIKKDLLKFKLNGLSPEQMAENIQATLKNTNLARYAKTLANTALNRYGQAVIDAGVKNDKNVVWVYRGHVPDNKIRPFCRCLMDKHHYYSKDDAVKIKNDPRRKYNCRHKVVPILKEIALKEGYTEGKVNEC